MQDVDEADYYHLLTLYGQSKEDEHIDGVDFIKQFLSADDLKILEERG